ncbi:MAG: hypothetical protein IIU43_00880, partial [Thermoguttaceae bacterium]|nr:hypothetical protein [Thermoguttaceae bacterium]
DFARRYRLEFLFCTGQGVKNSKHFKRLLLAYCCDDGIRAVWRADYGNILYRRKIFTRTGNFRRARIRKKRENRTCG